MAALLDADWLPPNRGPQSFVLIISGQMAVVALFIPLLTESEFSFPELAILPENGACRPEQTLTQPPNMEASTDQ